MRKYLDDINYDYKCIPNDKRQKLLQEQQEKYGFDERETWDINQAFITFVYERLMMYNEVNNVNCEFCKVDVNGKEYTLQECIDKMLELCKVLLFKDLLDKDYIDIHNKFMDIFKASLLALWW